MAGVFFVFYVIGVPALFGFLVYRNRKEIKENDPLVRLKYGFLFACYKRKSKALYWYELIYVCRRLALSLLITLYPVGGLIKYVLIVILLIIALEIQITVRPYRSRIENNLEKFGILTILITFISMLVLEYNTNLPHEKEILQNGVFFLNMVIFLAFIVGFAKSPVQQIWTKWRHSRQKKMPSVIGPVLEGTSRKDLGSERELGSKKVISFVIPHIVEDYPQNKRMSTEDDEEHLERNDLEEDEDAQQEKEVLEREYLEN